MASVGQWRLGPSWANSVRAFVLQQITSGEPWLNFEADALAKSLDEGRVRPVLLDLQSSDVVGPLAQFQATIATDYQDMQKLFSSLNVACTVPLDKARLQRAFDRTLVLVVVGGHVPSMFLQRLGDRPRPTPMLPNY